jgi:antitoxin YefM
MSRNIHHIRGADNAKIASITPYKTIVPVIICTRSELGGRNTAIAGPCRRPAKVPRTLSSSLTCTLRLRGARAPFTTAALFIAASPPALVTIIQVMTMIIPLADAKARLSAVLDDVRDTHDRVVITRNGRPEAVIISVSDLETIEETLDLLSTPGAIEEIRTAEAEIARGEAIGADELRRLMAERGRTERDAG